MGRVVMGLLVSGSEVVEAVLVLVDGLAGSF